MCRQPPLFHCFFFLLWSLLKFNFHPLVLIMDAAIPAHIQDMGVLYSSAINTYSEWHRVIYSATYGDGFLNKINLWMMENLF